MGWTSPRNRCRHATEPAPAVPAFFDECRTGSRRRMNAPSRRSKPRTEVGRLIRAWPRIRLAIRVLRLAMRARMAIQTALVTMVAVAVYRVFRRLRPRPRGSEPLARYAPPPVRSTVPAPAAPVDAEAPTETER